MRVEDLLLALTRAEICGASIDADTKSAVDEALLAQLYNLSEKHSMAHIAGQAMGNLGLLDNSAAARKFKDAAKLACRKHMVMDREYRSICRILQEAQIPYLPLKGAVIRRYYPEEWLRNSSDIDILIPEDRMEQAMSLLMQQHGYTTTDEIKPYDVSLYSPRGVHLELHFSLVVETSHTTYKSLLDGIWDHVLPVEGCPWQYQMPDDWFYLFHIVHIAKHFRESGCGIRLFLDTWILNHRVSFDQRKREALLEQCGLLTFAKAAGHLAEVWFSEAAHTSLSRGMEDYVIGSGLFGTAENKTAIDQAKAGGQKQFFLSRIFVPYEELRPMFPVLKKHKWLTPLFQIVRWLRIIFVLGPKKCMGLFKRHSGVTTEEYQSTADLLDALKLL